MKERAMESIFTYTDSRLFLKDYIHEKKLNSNGFSFKVIADRAGFKARDYILRVMNGSRNLSQSGVCMLSQALRFSEKEAEYFTNLVGFNQAKKPNEKDFFFNKISAIRKHGEAQKLRLDQFEYLSEWYYSALRSLLPVMDFKDDFAAIGKFLDPPLTPGQAKKAISLLLQLGLLEQSAMGKYTATVSSVSTGDEVASVALMRFHKQSIDLSRRALDYFQSHERDMSGVTMSLSREGFKKVKEEAQRFRKRIMEIAADDADEDGAFQLNLQLFPLSKRRTQR
jgi:uncharacterized protein (TIGR02147 family)